VATPVLYLLNSLGYGGTERQLTLTLRALDRDAFPPAVVSLFEGGPHADEIRRLGIPVTLVGAGRKAFRSAARTVARRVAEHGARIVHTALFESNVVGALATRRAGAIHVIHLVNQYRPALRAAEPESRPRLRVFGAAALERWTARRARTRFVAVAEVVADSAARYFGVSRDSIPVVRRGFRFEDLESAAARPLDRLPWSAWSSPRLLAVGKLYPQKGHRYLVRALPDLVEAFPKAQVVVVGEGPLRRELTEAAAGAGLEGHLRLVGSRNDVPSLMRASDAFVFPSLWEGAAGALLEAALLATPVVAADIGPVREILGSDVATLVPPKDPQELAKGLVRTLRDPAEARDRAVRAAARVRADHDIEANTRRLEQVYRRFVAGGAWGPAIGAGEMAS
jgi:glycosyltransferase involved in cell wall biosynthesis